MRAIRVLALACLLAGSALAGRTGYLQAKAAVAELLIRHAWEQSIKTGKPQTPWSWADTYPVARLRIPSLHYDEFVLEGATPRTLAFGPAHLQSGSRFGENGNVIIAGHRTSWFKPLAKIAEQDTITLEWFDGHGLHVRRYAVEKISVVEPKALPSILADKQDRLTLLTCYPFGARPDSPQRFVVHARPVP